MKILWIYNHREEKEYDCWLHLEFAKKLAQYHDVVVYGRNVDAFYPELCQFKWNKDLLLADMYKQFTFDVVIADTKNRMFDHYRPSLYPYDDRPEERGNSLLPRDFHNTKVKKICLEEDYQYETDTSWYINEGFDLLLHRHRSNWLRTKDDSKIRSIWFPFSVDTNVFKPSNTIRENKILFACNSEHEVYTDRREVRKELNRAGILTDCGASARWDTYVSCLQSHVAVVNGSGLYQITPAKVFEIIASGAVLLTDDSPNTGIDLLFPDTHVMYKKDGSDVIDIATELLQDGERIKSLSDNGLRLINERHTHEVRINDLMQHIHDV